MENCSNAMMASCRKSKELQVAQRETQKLQTKAQLAKITIPKVLMYIAILAGTKLVVWWATKTLASGAVPGASTATRFLVC